MQLFQRILAIGCFAPLLAFSEPGLTAPNNATDTSEKDNPVGFHTSNYDLTPNLNRANPPFKMMSFDLEQSYNGCLPVGMQLGQYYASGFNFNRAEKVEIRSVRISVEDNGSGSAVKVIQLLTGKMESEKIWDGNTDAVVYSKESAEASQDDYQFRAAWYRFSLDSGRMKSFVEVLGDEIVCDEENHLVKWLSQSSDASYPSKGYLKLYYDEGRLVIRGKISRYKSFMGVTLGEWGSTTDVSFELMPLVGKQFVGGQK